LEYDCVSAERLALAVGYVMPESDLLLGLFPSGDAEIETAAEYSGA
jgi:hypothetical protein